ncbi:hypothetical protein N8H74_26645 [Pseudomonas sp. B2M1-30]|uniref:Uncharacterized protein n=1 Tax=Pseudomonas koreensis TaxID=198620 RepID=A0A9X2XKM4_9PSED|nr:MULTISPECIES: hypothetical protein [Pseudomonas]MCU0121852.1 hypothetical protein [Pseudomonas sp. B2M1-30]MCU7250680.1 hypothetical protein [Pseudomonas koreensis]MCU7264416.1 hypothetical protein [Pseudomonas koreensis]
MDLYEDEVALWSDFVAKTLTKTFTLTMPPEMLKIIADLADKFILERRKREVVSEDK